MQSQFGSQNVQQTYPFDVLRKVLQRLRQMAVMPGWTPGNQGLESIESLDRRPYFQPLSNLVVTFGNIQPTHDLSQRAAFRLDSIRSTPTFVPSDVQPASPGQSGIRVSAINEWFTHLRR